MTQRAFIVIAGLALALALNAAPARAQANRTFVSGHGLDSNPCSLGAPCRSFAFALTQTNAGGEIAVLDTAGYGTLTINKAVSITAPDGIEAGVTTTSATPGITITAGANDVVNLRGLTLVGLGTGTDGIQFNTGKALNVQNCKIGGFAGNGINAQPTGASAFSISDTIVSGNPFSGIAIVPTGSSTVTAVFKRVEASSNGYGFAIDGSVSTGALKATIADSVASNNAFTGIRVISATGHAVTVVMAAGSQAVNNNNGLISTGANAFMLVGQTTVFGNGAGWLAGGPGNGQLLSYGNNYVDGNGSDQGTMPVVATK